MEYGFAPNAPRHVHTTPLATNLPHSHVKCKSLVIGSQEKRKQTRTKYKQTLIKCKQTRKSQKIFPPCLYAELGWESLSSRRWSRSLTLFYKMMNNLMPKYTMDPIPQLQQSQYSLRNQDVIGRIRARTEKFKSSFYPNCLSEWNELCPEIRTAPSVAIFKKKLLSKIRPPAKSVFGIHDPIGLSYLTQLRVGLSKSNLHKFKHNFRDTINPMCPSNDGIESTEHFLLLCPSFEVQRRNLLAGVFALLRPFGYIDLSNEVLTQLLLFGDKGLPNDVNRNILELTLLYIHTTGRLN